MTKPVSANNGCRVIFWDFDGVLMDTNSIRTHGFIEVLKDFPKHQVDELILFHQSNGGLSRYVKFRHFFEHIRGEMISDAEVQAWADSFSAIMLGLLVRTELLIPDTTAFVKAQHQNYAMHIVSGSDQNELRKVCDGVQISQYFKSIVGSPTPKKELISSIIETERYTRQECVLIGDSINDLEAAEANFITFIGYNNSTLKHRDCIYIEGDFLDEFAKSNQR